MNVKNLLNIDIISVNCTDSHAALLAIKHCKKFFNFGRSVLFTNDDIIDDNIEIIKIKKLNSVDEYNDFILSLNKYLDNDFVLIIQDDGFIINPNLWDDNFLLYDYIGAPWSSFEDNNWINLQNEKLRPYLYDNLSKNRIGNGGFSLRSRKFLEYSAMFNGCEGFGEDVFLNIVNYNKSNEYGIKYPPFNLAIKFSYENPFIEPEYKIRNVGFVNLNLENHFGFHGYNFANSRNLINIKYQ